MDKKHQVISISFFRFKGLSNKWWGFTQMGAMPNLEESIDGVEFSKLLGSGAKDGFSIAPNFGVYALLIVWKNESSADHFFKTHKVFQDFKSNSEDQWTVFMHNTMVHGEWDGKNPFTTTKEFNEKKLVAVITRATIKTKHLIRFWRFVPKVSESVANKKGRLFSVGIGELPLIQQATFSLWENSTLMMDYAYKSQYHKEVVQKTRSLGWYKEELFARFEPYKSVGSWNGKHLLDDYLKEVK